MVIWGISSQAGSKYPEGSTTTAVMKRLSFTKACVLGDGCIGTPPSRPKSTYLSFTHSGAQRDYLVYKMKRINAELGTSGNVSPIRQIYDARTGKSYESCQAMVTSHRLKELQDLFYPSGRKEYTVRALSDMDEEALAILWMDDGCVVNSKFARNRGLLATYCPLHEAQIVCDWIQGLTGVHPVPYVDRGHYRVRINGSEMPRFVSCIRKHVHSSMAHKVTLVYTHYNTKSKREYESSLSIPFVDAGDKAA